MSLLSLLLPLGLSACADTLTAENSPPSSQQLQRDYDKTLTKDEQKAVISDLQSATAKGQAGTAATASTGAASTQKSN